MPIGDDEKPGIKDLFHTIKKSPALIAVTVFIGAILLYLILKYGPGSGKTTASTTPSAGDSSSLAGSQLPGSYYLPQESYVQTPNITLNPAVVIPAPAPAPTAAATVPSVPPPSVAAGGATIPTTDPQHAPATWYTITAKGRFADQSQLTGVSTARLQQLNPRIYSGAVLLPGWKIRTA